MSKRHDRRKISLSGGEEPRPEFATAFIVKDDTVGTLTRRLEALPESVATVNQQLASSQREWL